MGVTDENRTEPAAINNNQEDKAVEWIWWKMVYPMCLGLAPKSGNKVLQFFVLLTDWLIDWWLIFPNWQMNFTLISQLLDIQHSALCLDPLMDGPRAKTQIYHQITTDLGSVDISTKDRAGWSLASWQWGGETLRSSTDAFLPSVFLCFRSCCSWRTGWAVWAGGLSRTPLRDSPSPTSTRRWEAWNDHQTLLVGQVLCVWSAQKEGLWWVAIPSIDKPTPPAKTYPKREEYFLVLY